MEKYKLGSLFDGSGGFPLAGTLCGIEPVWASEIEPFPIAVTRSRFPTMKHLGDISKIDGGEIEPVDIITFGSPCQDLSVAGKRAGLKHEDNGDDETTRSGLFMEAVRIIKEMREATDGRYPTFALWENVPGAFSSNGGEDFRIVLEELIKIVEPTCTMPPMPKGGWPYADAYMGTGWSLAYRTFDAQYWGVPQRRRRIHLVADFRGERAEKILFEREGLRGYFAEGRTPWEGTSIVAEGCAGADDRKGERVSKFEYIGMAVTLEPGIASREGGHIYRDVSGTLRANAGDNQMAVAYSIENHPADSRVNIDESGKVQTLTSRMGTGGGNVPMIMIPFAKSIQTGSSKESNTSDTFDRGEICANELMVEPICCIDGDKIGKAERSGGSGLGIREGDKMYTLTAKDAGQHAIAYAMQAFGKYTESKTASAMKARDYKDATDLVVEYAGMDCQDAGADYVDTTNADDKVLIDDVTVPMQTKDSKSGIGTSVSYIVRRLTPIECARLQGFADRWGDLDKKQIFTDEEYAFWLNVRNTHAGINGRKEQNYTQTQMLTWYNKLATDSAEYKMYGNGIALPVALYCMQGIADALVAERAGVI